MTHLMKKPMAATKVQFESEEEFFNQAMNEEFVAQSSPISDFHLVVLQSVIKKLGMETGLEGSDFINQAQTFISEITAAPQQEKDSGVQIFGRKILRRIFELALIITAEPSSKH